MSVYTGLVHYPVYNKNGEKIVSCITTLDVHDMARLARTYDIQGFYIINPVQEQQILAKRIIDHWTRGYGSRYNPDRKEAIELARVVSYLEDAAKEIEQKEGIRPVLIATDANKQEGKSISFSNTRLIIEKGMAVFLIFGTAWGLHRELLDKMDHVLEPIYGRSGYRHLSVRTAAAIIIDRLMNNEGGIWKDGQDNRHARERTDEDRYTRVQVR